MTAATMAPTTTMKCSTPSMPSMAVAAATGAVTEAATDQFGAYRIGTVNAGVIPPFSGPDQVTRLWGVLGGLLVKNRTSPSQFVAITEPSIPYCYRSLQRGVSLCLTMLPATLNQ